MLFGTTEDGNDLLRCGAMKTIITAKTDSLLKQRGSSEQQIAEVPLTLNTHLKFLTLKSDFRTNFRIRGGLFSLSLPEEIYCTSVL